MGRGFSVTAAHVRAAVASLILASAASSAIAAPIFIENFEGNLSAWVGQNGGSHSGQIVSDPLRAGNNVLTFSQLKNGGDLFGPLFAGGEVRFQFEYLGLAKSGSVPDNFGGFFGYQDTTNPAFGSVWLASTQQGYDGGPGTPTAEHLVDDGAWHSYDITAATDYPNVRVILEDWITSGGVAGDAYFDNISVTSVPEPGTAGALLALVGVAWRWRRSSRSIVPSA